MQMEGEQWRQLDQLQRQLDRVNVERLMVEVEAGRDAERRVKRAVYT